MNSLTYIESIAICIPCDNFTPHIECTECSDLECSSCHDAYGCLELAFL